jgi:hypothetical protein
MTLQFAHAYTVPLTLPAMALLAAADDAEQQTHAAGFWNRGR